MKTNDIRRVIDASFGGLTLTPEQRAELLSRALEEKKALTPPRLKFGRWIAIAALIALLTLMLLVPATGGTTRQEKLTKGNGQVSLSLKPGENVLGLEGAYIPERIGEIWGDEFRNKLIEFGAQVLLPKWIPDGYQLTEVNCIPDFLILDSRLRNEAGERISLEVTVIDESYLTSVMLIESIDGTEETWTYCGINYEYSENYHNCSVLWTEGNCRVYLSAPRDRELAMKIIESIYE